MKTGGFFLCKENIRKAGLEDGERRQKALWFANGISNMLCKVLSVQNWGNHLFVQCRLIKARKKQDSQHSIYGIIKVNYMEVR